MSRKDFDRMTQDIIDSVEKAIDSIPYEEIGKRVSQEASRAKEKIREGYEKEENRRRVKKPRNRRGFDGNKNNTNSKDSYSDISWKQEPYQKKTETGRQNSPLIFAARPKGTFAWFFFLFFGILMCTATGLLFLSDLMTAILYGGIEFGKHLIWMMPLFLIGVGISIHGSQIRQRLKRFRIYKKKLEGKEYCQLKVLEKTTGKSVRYLKKDLGRMIALGMFPQAHLDEQGTCLMLTQNAYDQYRMMMQSKEMQKQEEEEKKAKKEQEERQKEAEEEQKFAGLDEERKAEIKKMIKDGEAYLERFHKMQEKMVGEEIQRKLSRLSLVTGRIFDYVSDHPEKVRDTRKFMSYYLPTTEKMLRTYQELDREVVQGENIVTAKKEILDTLDTINYAFENLLDSLYEDTMMDISTDIAVLETMLAQEGLTEP